LVGGLHTDPVLIAQDRTQCGIHVELHPLGVRTLLGAGSADLSGRVVALEGLGRPALPARRRGQFLDDRHLPGRTLSSPRFF
jgi:hypothetical protein